MIAGLTQMALRAQARGIKLFGATLTPFGNETFLPGAWNPVREGHRVAVNTWIRESGAWTASSISTRRCATPSVRPRCCRSTIAAMGFTRAISVIARWATPIDLTLFD